MNLQQIQQVERSLSAIEARLGPLLDPDYREALKRVDSIMAEVRHFAVCWADAPDSAQARSLACRIPYNEALQEVRTTIIDRLVQTIRPD